MRISDWSSDVCSSDLPEITLTSLIDVVFTLIIFFVVTTTFDSRAALHVSLPRASAREVTDPNDALLIQIDAKGRRSEERRVGKEGVSPWSSRWSPSHYKKNTH